MIDGTAILENSPGHDQHGLPGNASMPHSPSRSLRIAVAHDWLCGYRGGEGVLERLLKLASTHHRLSRLYVMFDNKQPVAPTIDAAPRTVSSVASLPFASGALRRWLFPLYPRAVANLSHQLELDHTREPIDLLISSSSAAVKGIKPPHGVPHLCYCHSPPRYVWGQQAEYTRDAGLRSLGLKLFGKNFQRWDHAHSSADYVTRLLANSTHTMDQVTRCYERSAKVIHPPVRTEFFSPAIERVGLAREDVWLYVGALEPYKRVDLAIDAANKLHKPLTIIGTGSMLRSLRRQAGETVRFLGRVDDHTLREHYRRARLLLFPQVEDFGIVAVEAQACGLPVVARRAGGALDIVVDTVTGSLFDHPTLDNIIGAILRCPQRCDAACRVNAERFAESVFDSAMLREIDELVSARAR